MNRLELAAEIRNLINQNEELDEAGYVAKIWTKSNHVRVYLSDDKGRDCGFAAILPSGEVEIEDDFRFALKYWKAEVLEPIAALGHAEPEAVELGTRRTQHESASETDDSTEQLRESWEAGKYRDQEQG